jgi:hypothetical protein
VKFKKTPHITTLLTGDSAFISNRAIAIRLRQKKSTFQ